VIDMPASVLPRWTRASVRTSVGTEPAPASMFDSAIVKQPARAAPISSSGLVPVPSSKREANEYGPS
jgi:hypothetical protein